MQPLVRHHRTLTGERWNGFSKGRQVLMIANELDRAGHWMDRADARAVRQCDERAFDLTDLTAADPKWRRGLRELLRFREMLAERYAAGSMDGEANRCLFNALVRLDPESAGAAIP